MLVYIKIYFKDAHVYDLFNLLKVYIQYIIPVLVAAMLLSNVVTHIA